MVEPHRAEATNKTTQAHALAALHVASDNGPGRVGRARPERIPSSSQSSTRDVQPQPTAATDRPQPNYLYDVAAEFNQTWTDFDHTRTASGNSGPIPTKSGPMLQVWPNYGCTRPGREVMLGPGGYLHDAVQLLNSYRNNAFRERAVGGTSKHPTGR